MGTPGTHSGKQRTISVGILSAPQVEFVLYSAGEGQVCEGEHQSKLKASRSKACPQPEQQSFRAIEQDGRVSINGEAREEWYFQPQSFFTLKNVKIGKGFHWERYQDQSFPGDLKLIARDGCVIAINVVGIEDYLQCVIASEMSPTAGFEFLKAHAVISRSWLLAQLDKRDEVREGYFSVECNTPSELIRWQDREDHEWFDFCADDHCQRYQGIPQAVIPSEVEGSQASVNLAMIRKTKRVIEATWGQVLWYDGRVCDARFSKCCGGALEEFKYCWENKEVPYLKYARDYAPASCVGRLNASGSIAAAGAQLDLREEKSARKWILGSPRAFCNTRNKHLLGQVLKDYDSETKDFYRWKVEYTAEELRQIILERTGDDYGEILDLIPLERGVSGRICRLKIVGSKKTRIIGKELEIRKTLSRSHLYSSAFVVEKVYGPEPSGGKVCDATHQHKEKSAAEQSFSAAAEGQPANFVLTGAGWGHGVGLCQIGAAAMGARGYDYRAILQHYYPNSTIKTLQPQDDSEAANGHFVSTKPAFPEELMPQDDSNSENVHLVSKKKELEPEGRR